ncbi:MAG: carbohydrate ABC transporter permease, partial [Lachnospiraceae bacterium]|nr:carbohydrate ABC transporter permease [Lachnospiraceae bacterium]
MKKLVHFGMAVLVLIILAPIYITLIHSFMGMREIELDIGSILGGGNKMAAIPLLPSYPTLKNFKELLLYTDSFYRMFWNSFLQAVPTVAGQILVAAPAAFVMAKYRFRGRRLLFWVYLAVMLMPFQVTMVSEYLVLKNLSVINTHLAIILPGIFGTFPVFILMKVFMNIEDEVIEAARLDGAGPLVLLVKIGMPIGKGGIVSVAVLDFLECINSIEAPLVFLRDKHRWPLSLFFPEISVYNAGEVFAASVIIMIPAVLV